MDEVKEQIKQIKLENENIMKEVKDILQKPNEYQINEIDGTYSLDKEVVQSILEHKLCKNGIVNNKLDHLLRMMCFIYDMHYDYSLRYIIDNGILEKKVNLIKNHSQEDTTQLIENIYNYIGGR